MKLQGYHGASIGYRMAFQRRLKNGLHTMEVHFVYFGSCVAGLALGAMACLCSRFDSGESGANIS